MTLIDNIIKLINVNLTNNNITPNTAHYTNLAGEKVIDNKLIYCDLSGVTSITGVICLNLTLTNKDNSIQKFNVLFRNNGLNPIINKVKINNSEVNLFINDRDTTTNSQMTNQEFMITYNEEDSYTTISTIRKYN